MTTEEYKNTANFWKDKQCKSMPDEQLKTIVEAFLSTSSVCALATGTGDYVRCTPLEYSYHDSKFWIFTEGSEKFIGLEKNKNVSLAVFSRLMDAGKLLFEKITSPKKICANFKIPLLLQTILLK